jgi:hypothetical protein
MVSNRQQIDKATNADLVSISKKQVDEHSVKTKGIHGAGSNKLLHTGDVDDVPVDSATTAPISSNWAFDHAVLATHHTQNTDTLLATVSALSSDHTWNGVTSTMTAGASLTIGNLVYIGSDSKMELADADAATTMPCIAIATATIAENASGTFLMDGFMRDDSWNWTVNGLLYVDTTAGALTQTAPTGSGDQIQNVGIALTADIILFNPSGFAYYNVA